MTDYTLVCACIKVIGNKWLTYLELLHNGHGESESFAELGLKRYCMSPFPLLWTLLLLFRNAGFRHVFAPCYHLSYTSLTPLYNPTLAAHRPSP